MIIHQLIKNLFFILLITLSLNLSEVAFANVNINIVAVNATAEAKKDTPVKYYLPNELSADDVVNTSGLDLSYDLDKGAYYLHGSVELGPKESKTIKIEVKDIWQIKTEDVDFLKKQLEENLAMLKGSEYYESGEILKDQMIAKLEKILAKQTTYSENVERRIEEYRADYEVLKEIKKSASSKEYLKLAPLSRETIKTVKFVVEVKNSSDKEPKTITQKHYLPNEVRADDVVESQGFEVRFDQARQQCYLTKDEELKPAESKRYEIMINDIWNIPEDNIQSLQKRGGEALEKLKDSEYESNAKYLFEQIVKNLDQITATQADQTNMEKYIGAYRANKKRYEDVQNDIIKIEMMLAAVQAKKLEEFEKSKVKNVLQKLQALRGIMAISEAVFGKKPKMTTTWKVIWGILVFVALFTAIHFFTWWKKSQIMGEEMAIKAGGEIKEVGSKEKDVEDKEKKK